MLNRRPKFLVELQRPQTNQDSVGEPIETWVTAATRSADIRPLQGKALEIAKQIHHLADYTITLRFMDGVKPTWRVKYGSRIFNIAQAINENEESRWLVLTCIEDLDAPVTYNASAYLGIDTDVEANGS